ncbi:MAG: LCP family protein [Actinomycetia bacterium]|nr:LCP family protein [Actinomycetes bacterium]
MRIQRERRKQTAKRWATGVGIALAVVLLGGAAYGFFWYRSVDRNMSKAALADTKLQAALDSPQETPSEPFYLLLTGNDKRPGEKAARADTIILAKVDPKQKKVWLLSIPRDTRVEIPGHGVDKINASKFYGGNALLVDTVKQFTGLPVNYYMDINFRGFVSAVDTIGGVWVDVDVPIDDWKADMSPDNSAAKIEPGYQLLDGYHALTYVRSRDFPDADFTRMRHQQEFFKALAAQMSKPGNFLKIPTVVTGISKHISSTMPVGDMVRLAQALQGIKGDDIQTATITGEWKSPYVWPDEERKAFLIDAMRNSRSFEETAPATQAIVPATVSVTVRNGAGISGVAASAADVLKRAGFDVSEVGNANQFVYEKTLVVYNENDKAMAQTVAAALPTAELVPSRGMYAFNTDILVVVGKDWASVTASGTVTP